jgi:hypothetical protein
MRIPSPVKMALPDGLDLLVAQVIDSSEWCSAIYSMQGESHQAQTHFVR